MTPKLTNEQRDALQRLGSPVATEAEKTRRVYFLVDSAMLESLRGQADMAAILQGLADAETGILHPLDESIQGIERRLRDRFGS